MLCIFLLVCVCSVCLFVFFFAFKKGKRSYNLDDLIRVSLTNLISFWKFLSLLCSHKMTCLIAEQKAVDVVYLGFTKAFDSFPQYSPGEAGCLWLGQVCSLLGEELAGWLGSEL